MDLKMYKLQGRARSARPLLHQAVLLTNIVSFPRLLELVLK